MPKAEMIQAAQATWGNTISLVAILITLMSGYLVAAYLVGSQLGRAIGRLPVEKVVQKASEIS